MLTKISVILRTLVGLQIVLTLTNCRNGLNPSIPVNQHAPIAKEGQQAKNNSSGSLAVEVIFDFLIYPATGKYEKAIQAVSEQLADDYVNHADIISSATKYYNENQCNKAIDVLSKVEAIHTLLVPRHHAIMSSCNKTLGKFNLVEGNTLFFNNLLDAIEKSGDGTEANPYHVLHVEAQYDFMKYKLKIERSKIKTVDLIKRDGRYFDRHTLSTNQHIWFEVTEGMKLLQTVRKYKN